MDTTFTQPGTDTTFTEAGGVVTMTQPPQTVTTSVNGALTTVTQPAQIITLLGIDTSYTEQGSVTELPGSLTTVYGPGTIYTSTITTSLPGLPYTATEAGKPYISAAPGTASTYTTTYSVPGETYVKTLIVPTTLVGPGYYETVTTPGSVVTSVVTETIHGYSTTIKEGGKTIVSYQAASTSTDTTTYSVPASVVSKHTVPNYTTLTVSCSSAPCTIKTYDQTFVITSTGKATITCALPKATPVAIAPAGNQGCGRTITLIEHAAASTVTSVIIQKTVTSTVTEKASAKTITVTEKVAKSTITITVLEPCAPHTAAPVIPKSTPSPAPTMTGVPISQIPDGQIQAPSGGVPISQIPDGQIQAPTGAKVEASASKVVASASPSSTAINQQATGGAAKVSSGWFLAMSTFAMCFVLMLDL
jgi:hypothetical protein